MFQGNFELPMRVMKFCVAEKNVMPSQLKEDALEQYLELCTDLGQADSCIECVEYAVDTGSRRALGMGLKVSVVIYVCNIYVSETYHIVHLVIFVCEADLYILMLLVR